MNDNTQIQKTLDYSAVQSVHWPYQIIFNRSACSTMNLMNKVVYYYSVFLVLFSFSHGSHLF